MFKIITSPLYVFFGVWFFIVFLYLMYPISYYMTDFTLSSAAVVVLSLTSFIFGYFISSLFANKKHSLKNEGHLLNNMRLLWVALLLVIVAFSILLFNFLTQGYPPLLSLSSYATYGRLKGFLYADLSFLFILSFYFKGMFKWFIRLFVIIILLLYIARGVLMLICIQAFFMICYEKLSVMSIIKEKVSLRKILMVLIVIASILFLLSLLSELRGQTDLYFKEIMAIKDEYRGYPFSLLWVISYMTLPMSNLFYLIDNWTAFTFGFNLYSHSVPAFVNFMDKEDVLMYIDVLPNRYSTVSTYLGWPVIDFSWFGVFFMNFLMGFLSLIIHQLKGSRWVPIKCIWLSSIMLLFFDNFFFFFPVITEVLLALMIVMYIYPHKKRGSFEF